MTDKNLFYFIFLTILHYKRCIINNIKNVNEQIFQHGLLQVKI